MCLGIPGQIVEILDPVQQLALVDVGGIRRPVSLACIVDDTHAVESCLGDWVLVHVGFAMNRIDAAEAAETLALLHQLVELDDPATLAAIPAVTPAVTPGERL
jgi:hydrogenase expression/formation protein HypC